MLGFFFIFRIAVRMPFQRRFAIGGFNLLRRSVALHTEHFVKIVSLLAAIVLILGVMY